MKGDDLATVLKGLAASVEKLFEITCDFDVKGRVPAMPHKSTVQLYKIAQEAVSNAIKHGKASDVVIELRCENNQLILTIQNNGQAFSPPASNSTRMGLRIMHYRANTIGAELDIKGLGKSGTIVTCKLPIKTAVEKQRPQGSRQGKQEIVERLNGFKTEAVPEAVRP